MTRQPPIRLVPLGIFAFVNASLCWLWWQAVQVERHPLPDPCLFPDISGLSAPLAQSAAEDGLHSEASPDVSSEAEIGSCAVSTAVLRQRQQWRLQRGRRQTVNAPQCGGHPAPPPMEELLQWTTLLSVVPLCAEAQTTAKEVYRRLAAVGGLDTPADATPGLCLALPVAALLEASGHEQPTWPGSSSGLLAVRMFPAAQIASGCKPLPDAKVDVGLEGAAASFAKAADVPFLEPAEGDHPPALVQLHLFVSSPDGKADDIRLHIGAGASLLLVAPRPMSSADDAAASEAAAAEAVIQALGRWMLAPAAAPTAPDAEWRVQLWLLGDGSEREAASDRTDASSPASAEAAAAPMTVRLHWDAKAFLRTYLRGFFEALTTLLDLSFASQVVPHSGLEELNWEEVISLVSSASPERQEDNIAEAAVLEEFHRRFSNLAEEWDSDQEYKTARTVNLSLYKPTSSIGVPRGFALLLPFWGFLTLGDPVTSGSPGKANDDGHQGPLHLGVEPEEAARLSGSWVAQLRLILGLQPTPTLTHRPAAACGSELQSAVCGKACRRLRCMWQAQKASDGPLDSRTVPKLEESTDEFSLTPEKAMLISSSGDSSRKVAVFLHPSSKGIADWEVGGLAADLHFSFVTQAADNIRRLRDVLEKHHDIRVADHIGRGIQHVMELLHCSVSALKRRQCAFLPAAALELLKQPDAATCDFEDARECVGSAGSVKQANIDVYGKLALLLARAALKDSQELLVDGSVEAAPFFSTYFNLAIHVPLLLPFILPTVASTLKAVKMLRKKQV
ncbi:hypothetical protein Efla_006991 [Eimeria flavescens]